MKRCERAIDQDELRGHVTDVHVVDHWYWEVAQRIQQTIAHSELSQLGAGGATDQDGVRTGAPSSQPEAMQHPAELSGVAIHVFQVE